MCRGILILMLSPFMFTSTSAWSYPPVKTVRYPRVYGATGHPYGPTQAHYQYLRQYGRSWHGYRGVSRRVINGNVHNHYRLGGVHHHVYRSHHGFSNFWYGGSFPYGRVVIGPKYGLGYGLPANVNYGPVYSSIFLWHRW